jgi:hypothetical protein
MREALKYVAIIVSVLAVACAIRTALIPVQDNMDTFIADLARQSKWAMYTAAVAAIATFFQAMDRLLSK